MDGLIERAARGDRDAMASIAAEHYAAVYRFCARRIGPEAAKDAAQDTFVAAQKAIRKFDGRSSLSTWLFGIAHNMCRNEARRRKGDMSYEHAFRDEPGGSSPENSLIDREALRRAMRRLSVEHREVVVLHELEEMTYEEAAMVIGVPVGTVKSRLHHAFLNLRTFLSEGATA
jgi:RNA polymerase sigma-70 factor (ECF subfamily)